MTVSSPRSANRDLASSLRGDLGRLARICYFRAPASKNSSARHRVGDAGSLPAGAAPPESR
ncbi:hypothetical protein [Streptomyces sp. NPDC046860]|uniref:hypothetical protein n=1 Tax=Streptomyces sp. NPDC046860 TaxID=3154495 RepID=UPI0033C53BCB